MIGTPLAKMFKFDVIVVYRKCHYVFDVRQIIRVSQFILTISQYLRQNVYNNITDDRVVVVVIVW